MMWMVKIDVWYFREKKTSAEVRDRMGIQAIGSVLNRNRLKWFGHVKRKEKKDWVRKYMHMEIWRWEGRSRKTWLEVVKNDIRHCGLVVSAPAWEGTGCEFDSWQCRIYIPCSLSLRLLGSLRGTYGLTQKLCF